MKMKHVFLFIFILCSKQKLLATGQMADLLIIGEDTSFIFSNPLEAYFDIKGQRVIGDCNLYLETTGCTALWRGYVATWLLENDSLFLVRMQTNACGDNPTDVDISKEFNTNRVFTDWLNTTLINPRGERIQYVHHGYQSIYEQEFFYTIEEGIVVKISNKKYVVEKDRLTFPSTNALLDTIKQIILRSLDDDERAMFTEEDYCVLSIHFNSKRRLSNIAIRPFGNFEIITKQEQIILENAQKALKNFPKLMKVNHPRYTAPYFDLFFNGYCILHPKDEEYGCTY